MNDNFKYLTHSTEDTDWGIYLTVAGFARVEPNAEYPPAGHPTGYHFSWNYGRVLQEYQINYITEGEGIIETRNGIYPVKEGSMILLRPDMWHRYCPLPGKGWKEHYVGFAGEAVKKLIDTSEVMTDAPVISIGMKENIVQNFQEIFSNIILERPGYQQICSGLVVYILGQIISIKKNENLMHSQLEKAIQKACLIIRDNPTKNLNMESLADDVKVNYSLFRKAFKKYTGLSPMQYHTSLRMKQAIHLLTNTDLSVKEISFNLGFCSVFYFSKLFKEKTNRTPSEFRRGVRNG